MIHICRAIEDIKPSVKKIYCNDCKQEQDFMVRHYEWYGWEGICLFCGGRFLDDEWQTKYVSPIVSKPSVRYRNIKKAFEILKEQSNEFKKKN